MKNILFLLFLIPVECQREKTFYDIRIFDGTKVEKLSKYVYREDTTRISRFLREHPDIDIDTPDKEFGYSLLMWSIFNGKYKSFITLLRNHANPNYIGKKSQRLTPLYLSATYIDNNYNTDDRYLNKLIEYGADPYLISRDTINNVDNNAIVASTEHLPYLKVFVEKCGVDVNSSFNKNSLVWNAVMFENINELYYLVVDKGASIDTIPRGTYIVVNKGTYLDTIARSEKKYKLIDIIKKYDFKNQPEKEKKKVEIINKYYQLHPEPEGHDD